MALESIWRARFRLAYARRNRPAVAMRAFFQAASLGLGPPRRRAACLECLLPPHWEREASSRPERARGPGWRRCRCPAWCCRTSLPRFTSAGRCGRQQATGQPERTGGKNLWTTPRGWSPSDNGVANMNREGRALRPRFSSGEEMPKRHCLSQQPIWA